MRISKLVRIFIAVFVVLSAVNVSAALFASMMNERMEAMLLDQAEYKRLGIQLVDASDFLTEQAKAYVQFGDEKHRSAYFNELDTVKRMDAAVSGLTALGAPQTELDMVTQSNELSKQLDALESQAFAAAESGDFDTARGILFSAEYDAARDPVVSTMEKFQTTMNTRVQNEVTQAENLAQVFEIASVISSVISAGCGIFGLMVISRKFRPIQNVMHVINEVRHGNTNININSAALTHDEIGELTADTYSLIGVVKDILDELGALSREIDRNGDIEYRMNAAKFEGSYKEMIEDVNGIVGGLTGETLLFADTITQVADGDFRADFPQMPGKKALLNQRFDALTANLESIQNEVRAFAASAAAGNLDIQSDSAKFRGDWADMLSELNQLVRSVAEKAHWYESILDAIPFPISVTDEEMNWTFINKATESFLGKTRGEVAGQQCSNWNAAICKTENCGIACLRRGMNRTEFSQMGMDFQVDVTRLKDMSGKDIGHVEVVQDISKMTTAMAKLNEIMVNVQEVSGKVSLGAKQIAETNQSLAIGATTQAAAVQQLNASIEVLDEKTKVNADNAKEADELAQGAKQNAVRGNGEMQEMLSSMEGIRTATGNIARIIKTIEDIAFQTNLLALNASVEAARAGEHGKGFAVVAEEVRNLASKSQEAAKETNDLITDSVQRVEQGTKVAVSTAGALSSMVTDFERVSQIIDQIAVSSSEQAESIAQISVGVSQMSDVTQSNSAASEENAAASEELASHSAALIALFDGM